VVIDTKAWRVDAAATSKRRTGIRASRGWHEMPKVQRHDPLPSARPAKSA
jgi:N-methylhydantoinase B